MRWLRRPAPPIKPQPGLEHHVLIEALDNRNDQFRATMLRSGEELVASAHDIELDCCRALVARGVTSGKLLTYRRDKDGKVQSFWCLRVDIARGAKLCTSGNGFDPYVPLQPVPVEAASARRGESPARRPEPVEA
jgi:hypothetical protein